MRTTNEAIVPALARYSFRYQRGQSGWRIPLSLLFLAYKNTYTYTHTHTRTPSVRIKTDRHRVLVHFYDVILIYIDTPAAGNRGALLKLNGTSFGGCEIFDTGQIVLSSFILASPVIGASGYRILRIIILPGVALSANQLLRNPELFPNYPAVVIVHREH